MIENIWFFISGFFIGAGFRSMYFVVTGKDIPLLKVPYKTSINGNIEIYNPSFQADKQA
ncbi:MAG: hypothetical protein ACFFG0_04450 [Candidatus Thorarchaeota archaeon]